MRHTAGTFEEAFTTLDGAAMRAAVRVLGSRAMAEDVACEALYRCAVRWSKVGDHATAWVTTVATNLALDEVRKLTRRGQWPRPAEATEHDQSIETESGTVDRIDLASALARLPRRQREVLALTYFADLSQPEVAAALNVSLGTVKQHSSRGLAALRVSLAKQHDSRPTTQASIGERS